MTRIRFIAGVALALAVGVAAGEPPPGRDRYGDSLPPGAVARLGSTRLRTTATVMAFAPGGKELLTAAGGRTIGRWDLADGRLLGETALPGPASALCWFSPDGLLLVVPEDRALVLWDLAAAKPLRRLAVDAMHATFSPDGRSLATAEYAKEQGKIRLWDVATGKDHLLATLPSYANDLTFDPTGKRLFAAVDNHSLRCWDVTSGQQLWRNEHAASYIVISPDGATLVSDTYIAGPLHLWDAASGTSIATMGEGKPWTIGLAFSPDSQSLAQATPKEAVIWDVVRREPRHRFAGAGPRIGFTLDGRSLIALGPLLGRWDVATGKSLYPDVRDRGHAAAPVAYAPDGRKLATGGADGAVRLWDLTDTTHRLLRSDGPPHTVKVGPGQGEMYVGGASVLQFTPDGRQLLTLSAPGTLALTDVAGGREARRFRFPFPDETDTWTVIVAARLAANGRTLVALGRQERMASGSKDLGQKGKIVGWEVAPGREGLIRPVADGFLNWAELSPDGRLLALPGSGKLLDLRGGGERPLAGGRVPVHAPFAFSPDGRLVAAVEPDLTGSTVAAVRVFETFTGRELARAEAPLGYTPPLAFSPDGRMLAAAGASELVVWESASGRVLLRLPARGRLTNWVPGRFANCVAFAPDGKTLATDHGDGTVLIWDLAPARIRLAPPPAPGDPEKCWADLMAEDARTAHAATECLAAAPEKSLALLRAGLKPELIDPKWMAGKFADLGGKDFAARESATRDLLRVAEAAESDLRQEMARAASPEARRRLKAILDVPHGGVPPPEAVRQLRALAVLEWIGSDGAKVLLRTLAGGSPDAALSREARAALERLGH